MKKVISIVLACLLLSVSVACSKNTTTDTANTTETTESTETTTQDTVTTPYAELILPSEYLNNVISTVDSQEPYVVTFSTVDGVKLYTLSFGKEDGEVFGTVVNDDKNTVVYIKYYDLDQTSPNYENLKMYQAGADAIMQNLARNADFVPEEVIEAVNKDTFDIPTSLVTLKYPAKWQGVVEPVVSESGVSFVNNGTPIFDLVFGQSEGFMLGTYNGTPIYMVEHDVTTDEQLAMQNDVNVIINNLSNDSNFVINENG